jgi:hypothetical protein
MDGTISRLKQGIKNYGMMLKNAYIPSHKKKQVRQTIKQMEKEVIRLQALEKLETARLRVDTTRARINKIRSVVKPQSGIMKFLTESPDYLGIQGGKGGGRRPSGRRRNNMGGSDFGLDFNL